MKICILGCGNQGAGIAALLASERDVEELVFADYDIERANRSARLVNSIPGAETLKMRCEKANAKNIDDVQRVAAGADVVIHAILPTFNLPVMKACLAVGAHYCDFWSYSRQVPGVPDEETIEAQLDLDRDFKDAGLSAIPCIGVSPGWTTLAAKYMIDQLDSIKKLSIRNVDWTDSSEILLAAPASVCLGLFLGPPNPIRLENGKVVELDFMSAAEQFEFLKPVGKQEIFGQTHGIDGIILQNFIDKPIGVIEEKGALLSGGLGAKDIWIKAIQQQTSRHAGAEDMFELFGKSFINTVDTNFADLCKKGVVKDAAFASAVEVNGTRNGENIRHTMYFVAPWSRSQKLIPWAGPGVWATIGGLVLESVLMMGRNQFTKKGVLASATGIDKPGEMLERIKKRGLIISEKIEIGEGF